MSGRRTTLATTSRIVRWHDLQGSTRRRTGSGVARARNIEPERSHSQDSALQTYDGRLPATRLSSFSGATYAPRSKAAHDRRGRCSALIARVPTASADWRVLRRIPCKLVLDRNADDRTPISTGSSHAVSTERHCVRHAIGQRSRRHSVGSDFDLHILFHRSPNNAPSPTSSARVDDKIELNRRMNETLEAMARALFKSWFVDFDPVRAKAEGRDPGLPKPLADLFPDSFEDSELGEIPKGWKIGTLAM